MAIDTQPFPMNVLDLEGKKVLLRPEAAEAANKSNVVIGEPRKEAGVREARRAIIVTRQPDGKEVIKITVKNSPLGGATTTSKRLRDPESRTRRADSVHEAQEPGSRQMEDESS